MAIDDEKREEKNSLMLRYKHFSAEAKGVLGTFFLSLLCLLVISFALKAL